MYIPILKNRQYENKLLRENSSLFGDQIIPLVEVISLVLGRSEKTVEELISVYDSYFNFGYFIDFFTFTGDHYKPFDPNKVKFSIIIRDEGDYNYLKDLLFVAAKSRKAIPVISIKPARDFILSASSINATIKELQKHTHRLAVRIDSDLFETFFETIHPLLRNTDYLLYDIGESSIEPKFFDIEAINQKQKIYQTIVLNSPRLKKLNNGSYKDCEYTRLIDNSIREIYTSKGFNGFGDYAGLKDDLPTNGGSRKGVALGLFYVDGINRFYSIVNSNTEDGPEGHSYVLKKAFSAFQQSELNPTNDCPAYKYMYETLYSKNKPGMWGQWKYITLLRYISQIKKSTKHHL